MLEKLRILENALPKVENETTRGRIVQDFSGFNWWMEGLMPGQGVAEGMFIRI